MEQLTGIVVEEPTIAKDLDALAALVDAYRVFYAQPSGIAASRDFVRERLEHRDSRFFVVRATDGNAAAFAHLLASFDTLSLRPIGILEDLYVSERLRRGGIGAALLRAAEAFARTRKFARLTLSTAHQNRTAQRLYLAQGYVPDQRFRSFNNFLDDTTRS